MEIAITGKSTSETLIQLLKNTFSQVVNTGKNCDLAKIHTDPKDKGKAVRFCLEKKDFRVTSNLCVQEFVWGFAAHDLQANSTTAPIQQKIRETWEQMTAMTEMTKPTEVANPALVSPIVPEEVVPVVVPVVAPASTQPTSMPIPVQPTSTPVQPVGTVVTE